MEVRFALSTQDFYGIVSIAQDHGPFQDIRTDWKKQS